MKFQFLDELSNENLENIEFFYRNLDWISIEQHPLWPKVGINQGEYFYFLASNDSGVKCFALVKKIGFFFFHTAEIHFGPIFTDKETLVECLTEIVKYCASNGFISLTLQLGFPTGAVADFIEYKMNKEFSPRTYFDRENWSSIIVDLTKDEEEILRGFSNGHKRQIKKALKHNLKITTYSTQQELEEFILIYIKMRQERGLETDPSEASQLSKMVNFLVEGHHGQLLLVKTSQDKIIGGLLLVFQGKVVRYYKGTSLSEFRSLPVLHLGFWHAMRMFKNMGFKSFDLWGYNHFVDNRDQVFFINQFKRGFGGDYIFYPKKMYFVFKPLRYFFLSVVRKNLSHLGWMRSLYSRLRV